MTVATVQGAHVWPRDCRPSSALTHSNRGAASRQLQSMTGHDPPECRFGHLERQWGTVDTAFREARTTDVAVGEARRALGGTTMATDPDDPEMAAIARNLGIRSHHRARPTRKPDEPPLTGTAAAVVRDWPGASRERAQQIAVAWTGEHYFTDVEAAAWWTVGRLGPDEALLASVLRENGVRPEHMMVSVRHETILARLRDGMAPEQLARILRDAGEL
jgi:hypothetical protein